MSNEEIVSLHRSWKPKEDKVCPICGGDGWMEKIDEYGYEVYVSCPCGIREKMVEKSRLKFATIPEAFQKLRLYQFSLDVYREQKSRELVRVSFDAISCWLDSFEEQRKSGIGLYIFSGTKGSGKTRIVASIANELVLEKGVSVKFSTSLQILDEIKKSWDRDSEQRESELLNDLARVDVLIVDDFGIEDGQRSWISNRFYQIINDRYAAKKVTLFTSNLAVEDLPYDDRITNRILEMTYQIPFPEESVRTQVAKNNMNDLMKKVKMYQEKKSKQMTIGEFVDAEDADNPFLNK